MAFKMKKFSGFGNSPMKNKKNFEKFQAQKQKAKDFVKKLKPQIKKKPVGRLGGIAKTFGVKQVLKRLPYVGIALTAYDIAKTAKKAIPGLKRRAKSGNVNIGRKI